MVQETGEDREPGAVTTARQVGRCWREPYGMAQQQKVWSYLQRGEVEFYFGIISTNNCKMS